MNQEQNNLNLNNFDKQGNNVIPNNQPVNNQNHHFNFNQQPINQMNFDQPLQQPTNQINVEQPINNTFKNGNTSNNNLNNKSSKKINLVLIIGIIAIVLVVVGIGAFFVKRNITENQGGGSIFSEKSDNISKLLINRDNVVAVTTKGDLYFIGGFTIINREEKYKKATKIASNVENVYTSNSVLYYTDKQGLLHYLGASYHGGTSDEIKEDEKNVKDIVPVMNLCFFIVRNDNNLYVSNPWGEDFCGLNNEYDEFTKIASKVKKVFATSLFNGYIDENNDLYFSAENTQYKKILENVKSVTTEIESYKMLILTNDNKLYIYENSTDNISNGQFELKLLKENVTELNDFYFKTEDDKYNIFNGVYLSPFIEGEHQILRDGDFISNKLFYGTLKANDIKEIMYYVNGKFYEFSSGNEDEQRKLIYLSTKNELVLVDKESEKRLPYNINSLDEVYNFVMKKNIVTNIE